MKKLRLLCMTSLAAGLLSSCLSEDHEFGKPSIKPEAQGSFVLQVNTDAAFSDATRALNENNYAIANNYTVKVYDTKNDNLKLESKVSELSDNLPKTLDIGSYRIVAEYGTESPASRDNFLMHGESTFTIKANDQKNVTVNCAPTCGKILVAFDAAMATYYKDYSVSFGGTQALGSKTINWAKDDTEPWYVALVENGENVTYTISLEVNEDYLHKDGENTSTTGTATGTFKLDRNKAKKLVVKPNYTPTTNGGMQLTITIDESTNDKEITYDIPVTWL